MNDLFSLLVIGFWVYIITCLIAPCIFFIKNTPRYGILLWLLSGTFILVFWAIYFDDKTGIIGTIIASLIFGYIGFVPTIIKKSKKIKQIERETNAIKNMEKTASARQTAAKPSLVPAKSSPKAKKERTTPTKAGYGIADRQKTIIATRAAMVDVIIAAKDIWSDPRGFVAEIDYTSFDGEKSNRKIKITNIKMNDNGAIYFDAYCYKSKMAKSFRADRITNLWNESGREIGVDGLFAALGIK